MRPNRLIPLYRQRYIVVVGLGLGWGKLHMVGCPRSSAVGRRVRSLSHVLSLR